MKILNGQVVTWGNPNQILPNHGLFISQGIIQDIGPTKEIDRKYPEEQPLNAAGKLILPGLICAHTHFYGAFARGMAIPGAAPANFLDILSKLWWPLDKALSLEGVYYSGMVSMIDAIRHGTTTLLDHHASQNAISGSLDKIIQSIKQTGLRVGICYEITDRDGREKMREGIKENQFGIKTIKEHFSPMLTSLVGLHAGLTLSDSTLDEVRNQFDDETGFHIHVAESQFDQENSLEKSQLRVVNRLDKYDILRKRTIAVHGIHLNQEEIELLAERSVWVSHQPRSNMNNGVGLPDIENMLAAGIKVCLGNDGFSNAMWEEWKTAYLVHKLWKSDPRTMPGQNIIKIGVDHNGLLVDQLFGLHGAGKIIIGAPADIIFVDYEPFTPLTAENIPWHILFGFREGMVTTTICNGKVLMDNRIILGVDEEKLMADAMQEARATWQRYTNLVH